jgi:protein AaeX
MLSEFAVGGVYLPPFFVYACLTLPLFLLLRAGLVRVGVLRRVWHPALFEFAVSLGLVSALVLFL